MLSISSCFSVSTALLALLLSGCGPMVMPMTPRMTPEDQRALDEMWNNMLTPVSRVDHQTLLDTMIAYWLYQWGVDRLRLSSDKYLSAGKVSMELDCDRANPDSDQFTVTVTDDRGRTVRRERYTRREVEDTVGVLWDKTDVTTTLRSIGPLATLCPTTHPAPAAQETAEDRLRRLERERRLRAVRAATQPATLERMPDK